jgi:hypothetical protein
MYLYLHRLTNRFDISQEVLRQRASNSDTTSSGALSGGSNRATALTLHACPYRATSFPRLRPQGYWVYRGDK